MLAFDFNDGITDGEIKDLSIYGNHAQVVGSPEFTEGGAPIKETDLYMSVNGVNYL